MDNHLLVFKYIPLETSFNWYRLLCQHLILCLPKPMCTRTAQNYYASHECVNKLTWSSIDMPLANSITWKEVIALNCLGSCKLTLVLYSGNLRLNWWQHFKQEIITVWWHPINLVKSLTIKCILDILWQHGFCPIVTIELWSPLITRNTDVSIVSWIYYIVHKGSKQNVDFQVL